MKNVRKLFSSLQLTAGSITVIFTGRLYVQGVIITHGAVYRGLFAVFNGNIDSAGTVVRRVGKRLVGTITPLADLVLNRPYNILFMANLTPIGNVFKQARRTLVGTMPQAGRLIRVTGKTLASSVTPLSARIWAVKKTLVSALGLSGNYGPTSLQRAYAGLLVSHGSITRIAGKVFASSVALVGTLTRQETRALLLEGVMVLNGQIMKSIARRLSSSAEMVGTLQRSVSLRLLSTLSTTGAMYKMLSISLEGVVASVGQTFKGAFLRLFGNVSSDSTVIFDENVAPRIIEVMTNGVSTRWSYGNLGLATSTNMMFKAEWIIGDLQTAIYTVDLDDAITVDDLVEKWNIDEASGQWSDEIPVDEFYIVPKWDEYAMAGENLEAGAPISRWSIEAMSVKEA
jgi:hypothetical protein